VLDKVESFEAIVLNKRIHDIHLFALSKFNFLFYEFKTHNVLFFHRRFIVLFRLINFFDFLWILRLCFREPPENAPIFWHLGHLFGTGILSTTLPHRLHM